MTMPRIALQSVLSKEALASPDLYSLIQGNNIFVNAMLTGAAPVHIDDMQPETVMSYYVDYYLSEVLNGGHEQFIRNSYVGRWIPWSRSDILDPIANGLAAMNAPRCARIFATVREKLNSDRTLQVLARNRGGFGDPYYGDGPDPWLCAIDREFASAHVEEKVYERNAAFVRSWRNVQVVPAADVHNSVIQMLKEHPDRTAIENYARGRGAKIKDHLSRRKLLLERLCIEGGINRLIGKAECPVDFKSGSSWMTGFLGESAQGNVLAFIHEENVVIAQFPAGEDILDRAATTDEIALLTE
jgi:Domain of unknown function (DUF4375)